MLTPAPPHCRVVWTDSNGRKRRLFAVRLWDGWDCRIGGYSMPSRRFTTYSQSSAIFNGDLIASQWGSGWKGRETRPGLWDGAPDSGFYLPGDYVQADLFRMAA